MQSICSGSGGKWLLSACTLLGLLCAPAFAEGSRASAKGQSKILSQDRATTWQPGLMALGGIPARKKICASLTPLGGQLDDTDSIQRAIDACPLGQVVKLSVGKFLINDGNFVLVNKGITLRGAGPDRTTLIKTDGAKPNQHATGPKPSPLIVVGPSIWSSVDDVHGLTESTNLTADAAKGTYSIRVASSVGLTAGQIVLLDEASGAGWQTDPLGRGQIWAAPDYRVVWKKRNPPLKHADDFSADADPTTPDTPGSWFSRADRPTSEVKEISSVDGNIVTFTTPIHISYRTSHTAQLSQYGPRHVKKAGVEDLKLVGGDDDNIRFQWASSSWAKNIDSTQWLGVGFAINASFRVELREFYIHDAAFAQVGGGGYAIDLTTGSAEILIENGIVVRANKIMVVRAAGAGSVVGYNYTDMAYINDNSNWIMDGLNASHMAGSHHVLFEGNFGHNVDNDETHGNTIYHTFFRNHLRGIRAPFDNQAGGRVDDARSAQSGPKRTVGLMAYSYWMSFVGNVLGAKGEMRGWKYETTFPGKPGIWLLGWDGLQPYPIDGRVKATTLRHGNFDYLTNEVKWDPDVSERSLPDSLYLKGEPSFFDAGRGYTWPWVDPIGRTKLHELPAKVRFEAGTPFSQP